MWEGRSSVGEEVVAMFSPGAEEEEEAATVSLLSVKL
jgi:hypothetical protein